MCMTFADKLKSLRRERGLTQMALAQATNVSLGVIADVESGRRNPSKNMARVLSQYFGVSLDAFIVESAPLSGATLDMRSVLEIADVVRDYMAKNGYVLTADQREALVSHFYQQNLHDADAIKQQLSVMAVLGSLPRKDK